MKCGILFVVSIKDKSYAQAATEVVFLAVMPLLYQGLLSISYMIHDPFGEDLLDFPIMAFQEYANTQCVAVAANTRRCPALQRTWGPGPSMKELCFRKQTGKARGEWLAAE